MKRRISIRVASNGAGVTVGATARRLKVLLLTTGFIFLATTAYALQIRQTELAELPERSEVVALAKVLQVEKKTEEQDEVTIKVASLLKGKSEREELKLVLTTRLYKDADPRENPELLLDPTLKVGDMAVFFLKVNGPKAELAAPRSIAFFQKMYFTASDK